MIKEFNDMEQMNETVLDSICGGSNNGANLFLSGVVGAAAGIIWPH